MRLRPIVALVAVLALAHLLAPADAAAKRKRGGKATKNAPVLAITRDGRPNILAHSAVVVDLKNGEELFTRNPDEVRAIASLSKLMAAMAVLDANIPLEQTTAITEEDRKVARGGAKSRLLVGMELSNRDLLHAALLASDNRSIPAMGRGAGLSPQELTAAMNKKAQELGLEKTHFEDPTGLNPGNVSTAREQVKALKAALGYPLIAAISRKAQHDVTVVGGKSKGLKIRLFNTDRVARAGREQILGGKTGYNDIARYCLVIAAKIEGREIAMAFLGAEGKLTRFGDFHRVSQWLTQQRKTAAAPTQKSVQ
jgi:serine-type D-Ala-D-Ala endopeptidase (penicillin-binding protein 7)